MVTTPAQRDRTASTVPSPIWIDVTDMVGWTGPPTGIQRVVVEYSVRLASHFGSAVRYFAYDVSVGSFEETDATALEPTLTPHHASPPPREHLVTRMRARLARFVWYRRGEHLAHRARAKLRRSPALPPRPRWPFGAGDHVVIIGGNWCEVGYAELLTTAVSDSGIRVAHVVHDMIPSLEPQWAATGAGSLYTPYMKQVFGVADTLIAVSRATERDVDRFIAREQIQRPVGARTAVVLHGDDPQSFSGPAAAPRAVDPAQPFLLCVGTLEIRKNHLLLYQAYREAQRRGVALPRLYIVGRRGWLADNAVHVMTLDDVVSPSVQILDEVSDAELEWLYSHCNMVLYPSLYEGWGLPIAEAIRHGKVCITSDQSSLPEVVGDLADYVSPYDAGELLERILHYCDPGTRAERESEILAGRTPRSWDDAFGDFCAALGLSVDAR